MQVETLEGQEELDKQNLSLENRVVEIEKSTLKIKKYTEYEALLNDLNNFVETGDYMINLSNAANIPGFYTGILKVIVGEHSGGSKYLTQIFYTSDETLKSRIFSRRGSYRAGTGYIWGEWVRMI